MKRYELYFKDELGYRGEALSEENLDGEWVRFEDTEQLRGELSLAEEGLASYQQENERLRKALSGRLQENERMRDALLAIHGSTGTDGLWENKAIHGVAADGLQEPQSGDGSRNP